jgi:aryl-alcohol dehydrogenase-like predicted oxidoreductase
MPYCRQNNISILAYSPMAQGLLTGKFTQNHEFEKGDHRTKNKLFEPQNFQHVQQALERLRPIAEKNAVSLAQLALAWVNSHIDTYTIAGARNADQVIQNARAAEVALSENDLARIDEIGRLVTDHLAENPVMWRS